MTLIDLDNSIPDLLAESATIQDLWETQMQTQEWRRRAADVLDFLYRYHTYRLVRARNPEGLIEWINHLERCTTPVALENLDRLDPAYGAKWTAYKELLATRLEAEQSPALPQALDKAHVKAVLDLIQEEKALSQKEIQEKLGLKRPNMTRILNLMEANELIERRKEGRENRIVLGLAALNHLQAHAEERGRTPRSADLPRDAARGVGQDNSPGPCRNSCKDPLRRPSSPRRGTARLHRLGGSNLPGVPAGGSGRKRFSRNAAERRRRRTAQGRRT
ncbi:MAG: MarR family transcriptional regulator [Desulfobacterales bacterium]|nr:MarR family transcriptional regulator [Desulfobacterales bacterium]